MIDCQKTSLWYYCGLTTVGFSLLILEQRGIQDKTPCQSNLICDLCFLKRGRKNRGRAEGDWSWQVCFFQQDEVENANVWKWKQSMCSAVQNLKKNHFYFPDPHSWQFSTSNLPRKSNVQPVLWTPSKMWFINDKRFINIIDMFQTWNLIIKKCNF